MIASLRAELLRLSKWPVTWVVIGVWLTLNLSFGYMFDYLSYRDAVSSGNQGLADALLSQLSPAGVPSTMVAGLPMFGGALVVILAALATGSGYGWNTWRTVFTQGPRRLSALGGTMLALAVLLAVFAVLWRRRADALYPGALFVRYAFLYSLGRFVIEYYRADALAYTVFGRPFPVARTISLLAMVACLVVHGRLRRWDKPSARDVVAPGPDTHEAEEQRGSPDASSDFPPDRRTGSRQMNGARRMP